MLRNAGIAFEAEKRSTFASITSAEKWAGLLTFHSRPERLQQQMQSEEKDLHGFDPQLPLAEASTPPASWYASAEFFVREKQALLLNNWQFVAPLALVEKPGSFHCGEFLGEPFVIVRGEDGELRAFYNVCRHHAAALVEGNGQAEKLTCPYHGWAYSLEGALLKAPGLGAVKNFRKEELGLVPIPLRVQGPFVLLKFSGDGLLATEDREPLFSRLRDSGYEKLQFHSRRSYEIQCNWKVYVDNYLDGGYHVPVLHGALSSQLELSAYRIENFDSWTMQSCAGRESERIGGEALYAWLFPNFMINRYGRAMDTNWVVPLGPDRCRTVFDFYFEQGCDSGYVEASLAASERVQAEDIQISESVQRGIASRGYRPGRYSVQHESGMHLFHQLLHHSLSS